MGLWSSIYRISSIHHLRNDAKGEIRLFLNGKEQTLHNPVEVYEEFILGRNVLQIHHWFVVYAKEHWKIEPDGGVIDECCADHLLVDFEDIVRLSEIIKIIIENPKLGKQLLPYDPEYVKQWNIDEEYDECDIEDLKHVNEELKKIIEEDEKSEIIYEYRYGAA